MQNHVKLVPLDKDNLTQLNMMYHVRIHPEVKKHLIQPPPETVTAHIHYINETIKTGIKRFFVIYCQENLCGYCHVTSRNQDLELGWALDPIWWGKGIGKSSVLLLIQLLKNSELTEDKTLMLTVKKDNIRAVSLYKKCGFAILNETENQEYVMQYLR